MEIFQWIVIQIYPVSSRFIIINLCKTQTHTRARSRKLRQPFQTRAWNVKQQSENRHIRTLAHAQNIISMEICTSEWSAHYNKLYLLSSGNDFFIIYVLMRYYHKRTDSKRLSPTKSCNKSIQIMAIFIYLIMVWSRSCTNKCENALVWSGKWPKKYQNRALFMPWPKRSTLFQAIAKHTHTY